ncbi:MAG: autotransporter domain-containing protein [Rhodospirillales bacterium]|nr:autotransporter domain-containing protein [Rhodospirillales bacterium]
MIRLPEASYRSLLLASVAGLAAFTTGASAAVPPPTNQTVSTQLSGPTTLVNLYSGDNLTVTGTGGLTITSAATGTQAAVMTQALGAGTIANSGTITNEQFGFGLSAIDILKNTSLGTIVNGPGGTVQATSANGDAIDVGGTLGTLTNAAGGTIGAAADFAIQVFGSGTITAISNSGILQTGRFAAIYDNSGYIGSITNNAGGVIQVTASSASGAAIVNYSYIGSITNSVGGVIQATGSRGYGAINNGGTIQSLVNAGNILAPNGTAIVNTATIVNGITNLAGGLIQGGPANGSGIAIDNSAALAPLSIVNAGTIIGAIKQSTRNDTLTVTGGAIVGNIIGRGGLIAAPVKAALLAIGGPGLVNFDLGSGSFTAQGNIINVGRVEVTSGTLIMPAGGGAISGAGLFAIAPGAVAEIGTNIGAFRAFNAGILDVGANAVTLSGNYYQSSTGSLRIGASGSSLGSLTVTGSANIAAGPSNVILHFTGPANLPASSTIFTAQGGLTAPTTLTVVSDSPNPYFQSPIVTDPVGVLTLTFAPPTQAALLGYAASLFPATSPYQITAASAYAGRIGTLSQSTYNTITGALSTLPPGQAGYFAQQAAPRSIATAAAQLADGLGANTALDIAMGSRQSAAHAATGAPGGHGIVVWGQPFGATAYQAAVQDFGGFSASTYGAALGADAPVAPDFRLGIAFSAGNSTIDYAGGGSGNTDTMTSAQFGFYGIYSRGRMFADAEISGGYNWFTSKQTIAFLGQQTGSYGGAQFAARAGIGYNLPLPGAVLTPSLSLRELHMGFDSYTMAGGSGPSAHVNAETLDLVQSRVGARIAYLPATIGGWTLRPDMHAYYLHDFSSSGTATSGSFSNGYGFDVYAPGRDANLVDLGVGLTVHGKGPLSVGASIRYTAGRSTSNDEFLLHLETSF